MERADDKTILAIADQCLSIIGDNVHRADDFFRVVGAMFNMGAFSFIEANPGAKVELLVGEVLDAIKHDVFQRADDCRRRIKTIQKPN